ncbi:pilus assembly protein TadC [Erysipelothrix rhusiopathiae]|uniref:hypothetical protein n=1 Tax=Erysipelothrix rhusiopathiae TaxID=1648 RepID=UPI00159AF581|nr:hypothetical protein [Erysipelothrix rhusiopathiae]QDE04343.1 pilus assembly protein TadC [Erysipelothrix rhusiopathiae]
MIKAITGAIFAYVFVDFVMSVLTGKSLVIKNDWMKQRIRAHKNMVLMTFWIKRSKNVSYNRLLIS